MVVSSSFLHHRCGCLLVVSSTIFAVVSSSLLHHRRRSLLSPLPTMPISSLSSAIFAVVSSSPPPSSRLCPFLPPPSLWLSPLLSSTIAVVVSSSSPPPSSRFSPLHHLHGFLLLHHLRGCLLLSPPPSTSHSPLSFANDVDFFALLRQLCRSPPPNHSLYSIHSSGMWRLRVLDGDLQYQSEITSEDTMPIAVVIPGLTNDSSSPYLKHLAYNTAKTGWNVVISNHRGLGGVSVTPDRFYNTGWTEDIRIVLGYLQHKYPMAPLFAIGTSIGANILEQSFDIERQRLRLNSTDLS